MPEEVRINDGLDRIPSAPIVHQVEGGRQIVVTPEAQAASAAAALFSQYNAAITQAIQKGYNKLSQVSQQRLDELYAQMRSTPPKPATVINLHPWPLMITGTRLLNGIQIAACPPGARFAHTHIRGWRKDWRYDEDGEFVFSAVTPIKLAGEFVREFSNGEFGKNNGCNGGVIIYEGERHPDKVTDVECYDANGRLMTRPEPGVDYEGEQEVPVIKQIPITRNLQELLKEAIEARNGYYFKRVQRTDSDYRDEKKRVYISLDTPRLMAQVLHAEGLLPEVPVWNLPTKMERGLTDDDCPACGAPRKRETIRCTECPYFFEPVEGYQLGQLPWEQLEMYPLTAEEWEQALQIKEDKESARLEAQKRLDERRAAQPPAQQAQPKNKK